MFPHPNVMRKILYSVAPMEYFEYWDSRPGFLYIFQAPFVVSQHLLYWVGVALFAALLIRPAYIAGDW